MNYDSVVIRTEQLSSDATRRSIEEGVALTLFLIIFHRDRSGRRSDGSRLSFRPDGVEIIRIPTLVDVIL